MIDIPDAGDCFRQRRQEQEEFWRSTERKVASLDMRYEREKRNREEAARAETKQREMHKVTYNNKEYEVPFKPTRSI